MVGIDEKLHQLISSPDRVYLELQSTVCVYVGVMCHPVAVLRLAESSGQRSRR